MLMKLSPGVNVINILQAAFSLHRSRKRKKIQQVVSLFLLLGSAHVKKLVSMLMNLTTDFGDSQLRPGHHGQRRHDRQAVEEHARKEQEARLGFDHSNFLI